ncbi:MAG: hypothetical protein KC587_17405 [Nitrospira sp.]|nr:hypothetical protein [Nitrospira sp.]MCA9458448.1 hypothetical protein [Nitrospira sp.]MCW5785426.1 hypothetical protein [Nitrospirales bacterium]
MAFAQTAEKAFRRPLIATALYQNINHIAILVDPTPELLVLPLHGDKDFVDLPCVA